MKQVPIIGTHWKDFMAIHWDMFRGGSTRPSNERINVTINKKNVLTFNRFIVKLLGNPEAVILMFEKKESIIGLVPSNLRDKYAFPLKPKGAGNWTIHAAPFCRHFGIVIDKTEKFDDADLDSEGVLRLDLRKTHNVSNRKRRGG